MENLVNLQYDWTRNKIITDTIPRLFSLVATKIALNLWLIETEIKEIFTSLRKVQDKIPLLEVPITVAKKIAIKVELIGEQLSEFNDLLPDEYPMLDNWSIIKTKIHWTKQATIDKCSTVEALTDDDEFDLEMRLLIAADCYLEDRINKLFAQLPRGFGRSKIEPNFERFVFVGGCPLAAEHFNIWTSVFDYNKRLNCMLTSSQKEMCYLYHWNHFTEQERLQVSESLYSCHKARLMFFAFTNYDRETKLQLLQDEKCCFLLLQELLQVQWLHMFDAFAENVPKALTLDSILKLLFTSAEKIETAVVCRKKYVQICGNFLSSICKEFSVSCPSSDSRMVTTL